MRDDRKTFREAIGELDGCVAIWLIALIVTLGLLITLLALGVQ